MPLNERTKEITATAHTERMKREKKKDEKNKHT